MRKVDAVPGDPELDHRNKPDAIFISGTAALQRRPGEGDRDRPGVVPREVRGGEGAEVPVAERDAEVVGERPASGRGFQREPPAVDHPTLVPHYRTVYFMIGIYSNQKYNLSILISLSIFSMDWRLHLAMRALI